MVSHRLKIGYNKKTVMTRNIFWVIIKDLLLFCSFMKNIEILFIVMGMGKKTTLLKAFSTLLNFLCGYG